MTTFIALSQESASARPPLSHGIDEIQRHYPIGIDGNSDPTAWFDAMIRPFIRKQSSGGLAFNHTIGSDIRKQCVNGRFMLS